MGISILPVCASTRGRRIGVISVWLVVVLEFARCRLRVVVVVNGWQGDRQTDRFGDCVKIGLTQCVCEEREGERGEPQQDDVEEIATVVVFEVIGFKCLELGRGLWLKNAQGTNRTNPERDPPRHKPVPG